MSVFQNATRRTTVRANATVRLCSAREQLWRAESRHAGARGTPAEASMLQRVGEAAAELATREQWLHWIEHGTTIRPAADGEWGFAPEAEAAATRHSAAPRASRAERARVTAVAGRGDRTRRLRSVT
jgi:hypothetical protein